MALLYSASTVSGAPAPSQLCVCVVALAEHSLYVGNINCLKCYTHHGGWCPLLFHRLLLRLSMSHTSCTFALSLWVPTKASPALIQYHASPDAGLCMSETLVLSASSTQSLTQHLPVILWNPLASNYTYLVMPTIAHSTDDGPGCIHILFCHPCCCGVTGYRLSIGLPSATDTVIVVWWASSAPLCPLMMIIR